MPDGASTPRKEINRNPRRGTARLSSVTTAIHLLMAFGEEDTDLGISELAERLTVAKSTVHRLAGALLAERLLAQNPQTGRYSLGIGLFTLGSRVRARLDVTAEAKHVLTALRDRTGENVRVVVLDRQNAVFLHDFEGSQAVRLRSATGQLKPAFCTAEGMCLVAGLRSPAFQEFLTHPRAPRTLRTVTDEDAFVQRIRRVKRMGYAFEDEECHEEMRAIGAPVHNAEGRVIAAIGMAGPSSRIRKSQVPKLAPLVIAAADDISQRLGYLRRQPLYV